MTAVQVAAEPEPRIQPRHRRRRLRGGRAAKCAALIAFALFFRLPV
jgi:hypothetical protein